MASATAKGGWKAAAFIIMVEVAERFSFYGITSGLITYLTDVIGDSTATAARNINVWQGVAFVLPLFGAAVADSFLGRFKTALFSSLVYLFGLVCLLLSASVIPTNLRRPFFYLSLYILAVAEGGHKPSVQTFAADQFDESTPKEKKTKASFFNLWYMGVMAGVLLGMGSVLFVQKNVGWAASFGIPTAGMSVALVVFIAGIRLYRRSGISEGSPLTRVAQVVVAAVRKRRAEEKWGILIDDGNGLTARVGGGADLSVTRTKRFRFLDKAMVMDEQDANSTTKNPWRISTLRDVEDVKQILRILPIWVTCFPTSVVYAQLFTFFTKQANTMEAPSMAARLKLQPHYIPFMISIILILILTVLYDRVLVPFVRRLTGHPTGITTLQRVGIGQFLSTLVIFVAALVEGKRVRVAKANGLLDEPKAVVPMSVWWLMPQYGVFSVAEVFAEVGMQQFFYDQMPLGLRSIGAAAYLILTGVGSFISSAVIAAVQAVSSRYHERWLVDNLNRAHLDGFYWVLTVLCSLLVLGFVWMASKFEYREAERAEV